MQDISGIHAPVMLAEAISALAPHRGGRYLDCTLGLGGHAEAMLRSSPSCSLCGLDRDEEALKLARRRLAPFGKRVHISHSRFGDFEKALTDLAWASVDGVLADLGVSSLQLDRPERGFSFRSAGPLDMRMDQTCGEAGAWRLVNRASHDRLRDIFATYGEEPQAGRIARHIIAARQKAPIENTEQLADIIRMAYPLAWRRSARRHPATRAFQALRMAVNDEPGQLKALLEHIWQWLAPGARIVIISFHSLEDRMVKQAFRARSAPVGHGDIRILTKKPLIAGEVELGSNPRAGSAKLRAAEKLAERQ